MYLCSKVRSNLQVLSKGQGEEKLRNLEGAGDPLMTDLVGPKLADVYLIKNDLPAVAVESGNHVK